MSQYILHTNKYHFCHSLCVSTVCQTVTLLLPRSIESIQGRSRSFFVISIEHGHVDIIHWTRTLVVCFTTFKVVLKILCVRFEATFFPAYDTSLKTGLLPRTFVLILTSPPPPPSVKFANILTFPFCQRCVFTYTRDLCG